MLIEKIGTKEMLIQLAEECSELSQACLKYVRYLNDVNPTFKTEDVILDNLHEEYADVRICLEELKDGKVIDVDKVVDWMQRKRDRIEERFSES